MSAAAVRPAARRPLRLAVLVLLGVNVAVFAAYTLPRSMQVRRATSRAAAGAGPRSSGSGRTWRTFESRADALKTNAADAERFYTSGRAPRKDLLAGPRGDREAGPRSPASQPGGRAFSPEPVKDATRWLRASRSPCP